MDRNRLSWSVTHLAMPFPTSKHRYVEVILSILAPKGAVLIHTYEYNQEERPTVPYSVSGKMLQDLWGEQAECYSYSIKEGQQVIVFCARARGAGPLL